MQLLSALGHTKEALDCTTNPGTGLQGEAPPNMPEAGPSNGGRAGRQAQARKMRDRARNRALSIQMDDPIIDDELWGFSLKERIRQLKCSKQVLDWEIKFLTNMQ